MAIGRMSFLDLSPEKRAQAAAAAISRLKTQLDNPFLTAEQTKFLQEKITQISHWEQGLVYTPKSKAGEEKEAPVSPPTEDIPVDLVDWYDEEQSDV